MEQNGNGSAVWKLLVAGLGACLASGIAFWFLLGANAVTRDDMRREIEGLRKDTIRAIERLERRLERLERKHQKND